MMAQKLAEAQHTINHTAQEQQNNKTPIAP